MLHDAAAAALCVSPSSSNRLSSSVARRKRRVTGYIALSEFMFVGTVVAMSCVYECMRVLLWTRRAKVLVFREGRARMLVGTGWGQRLPVGTYRVCGSSMSKKKQRKHTKRLEVRLQTNDNLPTYFVARCHRMWFGGHAKGPSMEGRHGHTRLDVHATVLFVFVDDIPNIYEMQIDLVCVCPHTNTGVAHCTSSTSLLSACLGT